MNHQYKARAATHLHLRKSHLSRQAKDVNNGIIHDILGLGGHNQGQGQDGNETGSDQPAQGVQDGGGSTTTDESSTVTTTQQPILPSLLSILHPGGGTTSTSSSLSTTASTDTATTTSSTTSATPTSASSSITSSQSTTTTPPPSSTPTPSPSAPSQSTISTTTTVAAAGQQTVSPPPKSSSGVNTGTLVGSIAGGMIGLAAVLFIMFFFIRRWRRKVAARDAFDAVNFRRSAMIIEDPVSRNGSKSSHNPRPPTMIERHVAHSVSAPAAASHQYPKQSQYAARYEREPQFAMGGNTYGQYGAYGAQQQRQYPQNRQQQTFTPGEVLPASYNNMPSQHNTATPNPFVPRPPPAASASAPMGLEYPFKRLPSPPFPSPQPTVSTMSTQYLNRRSVQEAGLPPVYRDDTGSYVDLSRDAKGAPGPPGRLAVVNNSFDDDRADSPSASVSAPALRGADERTASPHAAPGNKDRPFSAHTAYNANDAYGGVSD